jgi:hypothetical protein
LGGGSGVLTVAGDRGGTDFVLFGKTFVGIDGFIILINPCYLSPMRLLLRVIPFPSEITGLVGVKVATA